MRFVVGFCLLALIGITYADDMLTCFECNDCMKDTGNPTTCSRDEDACMKVILGKHIVRRCSDKQFCGLGKSERAANRAWTAITNVFKDIEEDSELVYCCDDDYCNGTGQQLPNFLVLLLPLVVIGLFKF